MSMKYNWPTTVDELVEECERLEKRYDLYTLGERGEPLLGESDPRIDGTDYLAGEYQYGVAMVPAQWVTSVLGDMEDKGTCKVMAEFKWHLMDGDTPEEGECDYIVMGRKGGLQLAKGYRVPTWCVGTWFYCTKGDKGRKRIKTEDVYAWAEIPPLEASE